MQTYKIIRFHKEDSSLNKVIKKNLSLDEAQEHCRSDETSSHTCAELKNMEYTRQFGAWFDGFMAE